MSQIYVFAKVLSQEKKREKKEKKKEEKSSTCYRLKTVSRCLVLFCVFFCVFLRVACIQEKMRRKNCPLFFVVVDTHI